jgi:hypothetical protein
MKKLIMKLLGLNTLVTELNTLKNEVLVLADENKELKTKIENLENVVEEMEIPDFDADDFVREDDVNDRIESYLNDNDYATQDWVNGEIEDIDISDKIEEAINDYDIDAKVNELLGNATTEKLCEDAVRKEVLEAVKVTLEKMVKALADQQK